MRIRILLIVLFVSGAGYLLLRTAAEDLQPAPRHTPLTTETPAVSDASIPLPRARERVVVKPFGISVSPGHSPVSPERFSGYHTGADFEILAGEDETALIARALCAGPVVRAGRISGYGGVVLQRCTLNGQQVTILYGHLEPSSLPPLGTVLPRGAGITTLGRGYSSDTDGERPHLHVGIVVGWREDLRGYVQQQNQLDGWLDPLLYIP